MKISRIAFFNCMKPVAAILSLSILFLNQSCKKVSEATESEVSSALHPTVQIRGVDKKLVAEGFVSPLEVLSAPGDMRKRLFVVDQIGKVWIVENGTTLPTPFLDLTSKLVPLNPNFDERGLLGLAFHPNYASNGRVFVYYQLPPRPGGPTTGVNWNNLSRIAEFRVLPSNPDQVVMASERTILEWDDPQFNHNGGTITFGPDGYLYIAVGDGGGANDVGPGHVPDWYAVNEGGNGQDVEQNLLGSILRIDVNFEPYGIPADNPFVGKPGMDEIYAYGFRNPYRMAFDPGGARLLYAGDAGQVLYEEVSIVTKGGNYGWNVKEGDHCFSTANPMMTLPSCPTVDNFGNPLIDPVIELNNWRNPAGGKATTVIGGKVYRAHSIPGWHGAYVFGTFSQTPTTPDGELFIAAWQSSNDWVFYEVSLASSPNDVGYFLKGFGQDSAGEVYLTVSSIGGPTGTTGKVFKLVSTRNIGDPEN